MTMKAREFILQVPELVAMQLPPELRGFEVVGGRGRLVKFHYGDPTVHYEVWVQRRAGQVEIGLHFEGEPETNARHLETLAQQATEIRQALGSDVEAEQWTRSWTRVHQSLPMDSLDEDLLMEVASRMASFIQVLQPIVEEMP